MDSSDIIMLMIAACVALVILMLFSSPIKAFARIALNSALGIIGILAANVFLTPFGMFVGVNILTVMAVGLLGFPGFIMLYITSLMFA